LAAEVGRELKRAPTLVHRTSITTTLAERRHHRADGMPCNPTSKPFSALPVIVSIAALWLHYFWCLVPSWRFGEYYEYGFLVPFLAFGFAWRRWQRWNGGVDAAWRPPGWARALLVLLAVAGLLALVPLRLVETGDPGWRPPLVLHGLLVTAATHLGLAR